MAGQACSGFAPLRQGLRCCRRAPRTEVVPNFVTINVLDKLIFVLDNLTYSLN